MDHFTDHRKQLFPPPFRFGRSEEQQGHFFPLGRQLFTVQGDVVGQLVVREFVGLGEQQDERTVVGGQPLHEGRVGLLGFVA